MDTIHDRFTSALKARLNGSSRKALPQDGSAVSPCQIPREHAEPSIIAEATAEATGRPFLASLAAAQVCAEFIASIPISYARRHGLVGLAGGNGALTVAVSDVAKWPHAAGVGRSLGKDIDLVFAPREEILRVINSAYQQQGDRAAQMISQISDGLSLEQLHPGGGNEDLLDVSARAPVIKLVNLMLLEAVKRRASDVHVQPYEDDLVVRLRVDGVLHDVFHPPHALHEEVISRIKVMGGMNIAERRLAQDGRATVEVGDRVVDLRIATLPTSFGERAVIRLLDKSVRLYDLGELGMPTGVLEEFRSFIRRDHGIILVTGPTGSGKSTTLYAALQEINCQQMNVLTLEDPIEYRLKGISQTQISDRKGMTFSSGLRHVLRQDPDVIMVGEIRDAETARMAIQSALTGHLVFSTLHTNDAAGAVARMLDLGVEPYLLASSLLAVLAQRLVRRICPHCKESFSPAASDLSVLEKNGNGSFHGALYRGKGCIECMDTGYQERVGIFELLSVTEDTRELILRSGRASSIKAAAISGGMRSLWSGGIAKAAEGVTTMEEVARVASKDEIG
ncbi:MAG: ATPase, T2SS/T4P/T4SS family [Phycisphaerae bacterium]|jgi:general secretion pathway protein E